MQWTSYSVHTGDWGNPSEKDVSLNCLLYANHRQIAGEGQPAVGVCMATEPDELECLQGKKRAESQQKQVPSH